MPSADASAEFWAFACGQGDSLLLRLGPDWYAVDCCLPASGEDEAWSAYERFLRERDVRRLRGLVITHYDLDHYRGARRVLQWFMTARDGVAALYSTASLEQRLHARVVAAKLGTPAERSEFVRLRREILAWCGADAAGGRGPEVPLRPVLADLPPFHDSDLETGWHLVGLHPFTHTQIAYGERLAEIGDDVEALQRIDHNGLSAAIMACHVAHAAPLLLLGGDVPSESWQAAINYWRLSPGRFTDRRWMPTAVGPRWIKVPHHGSFVRGHSPALLEGAPPPGRRHAVISASSRRSRLPDGDTIAAYQAAGLNVWTTGWIPASDPPASAGAPRIARSAAELVGRPPRGEPPVARQRVRNTVFLRFPSAGDDTDAGPAAATIPPGAATAYASRADSAG